MPVTTSYPGIYIEELASNAHSITAAPTSITVFVGYTHPFKTASFDTAVELFSFTDYENYFGGLYASGEIQNHVAYAVYEFFLNGGSQAYVVGLQPEYLDGTGASLGVVEPSTAQIGDIVFTAREPTDATQMTVTVNNLKSSGGGPNLDIADVMITYGARVETYRGVTIDPSDAANFIEARIGTAAPGKQLSSLVTVAPSGADYGVTIPPASPGSTVAQDSPATFTATPPGGFVTTFSPSQFSDVFQADTSLDKVHDLQPHLSFPASRTTGIWSAALAFAERRAPSSSSTRRSRTSPIPTRRTRTRRSRTTSTRVWCRRTSKPERRALLPVAEDARPAVGQSDGAAAERVRRGDLRDDRHEPRRMEGAGGTRDRSCSEPSGVVDRGVMTDIAPGRPQPDRRQLPAHLPRHRHRRVRRADARDAANSALEQWWYVPVRRMALFIEQSLLRQPRLGGLRAERRAAVGRADHDGRRSSCSSLFKQGAFRGRRRARRSRSSATRLRPRPDRHRPRDREHRRRLRAAEARPSSSSSRSRSWPARRSA